MSEVLNSGEFGPSTVTAGALGEVAAEGAFEPGVVEQAGKISESTLGHSGNGGDGSQGYHIPGNFKGHEEVRFS